MDCDSDDAKKLEHLIRCLFEDVSSRFQPSSEALEHVAKATVLQSTPTHDRGN
jgi:hypothetical protein